jgi:DNA-binding NarL/FixJ family response regulator
MSTRALLADDHPLFLDGLRILLESAGVEVVGAASDGVQLLELADRVTADVVVVDIDMPGRDGISAVGELRRRRPDTPVLVLTMHDDPVIVRRALAAGARGYVLKGAAHGSIVRAVLAVADGDTVLGGSTREALLATPRALPPLPFPGLTPREREVLELVAQGHGNAAIAARLHLSIKTVQNVVSSLFAKLGVGTRAEAVARARDAGLGSVDAGA